MKDLITFKSEIINKGYKSLPSNAISGMEFEIWLREDDINNINELSEQKQKRLNCVVGIGINNWDCYTDCAFWNGKKCTNHE